MKFRRKRQARRKTVPAFALKGSGMGHSLSMAVEQKHKNERVEGQASQGRRAGTGFSV
jgi:hypothetical protein